MNGIAVATWDAGVSMLGAIFPANNYANVVRDFRRATYDLVAGDYATIEFADSDIGPDSVDLQPVLASVGDLRVGQIHATGSSLMREVEPRLRELQSQYIDDYSKQISQMSIFALRALLASAVGLRRPLLSSEPSGHLIATWRKGTESVSLRLLSAVELHFAFGGTARLSGANDVPRYGRSVAATFFTESIEARQIAT